MENPRPWSEPEEIRGDNEPPIEWELARFADDEEVPFDIPRD